MQIYRHDRHVGCACDFPETDPPANHLFTRAFRCDTDPAAIALLQHPNGLVEHGVADGGDRRDAAIAPQNDIEYRDLEQHGLAQDADIQSHRRCREIDPNAVPVGRVRRGDQHRLRQIRQRAAHLPAAGAQQPRSHFAFPRAGSGAWRLYWHGQSDLRLCGSLGMRCVCQQRLQGMRSAGSDGTALRSSKSSAIANAASRTLHGIIRLRPVVPIRPVTRYFLNSRVLFCTAACVDVTIPSQCGRIPTWGRELARYRFDRGGLFTARTSLHGAKVRRDARIGAWIKPNQLVPKLSVPK